MLSVGAVGAGGWLCVCVGPSEEKPQWVGSGMGVAEGWCRAVLLDCDCVGPASMSVLAASSGGVVCACAPALARACRAEDCQGEWWLGRWLGCGSCCWWRLGWLVRCGPCSWQCGSSEGREREVRVGRGAEGGALGPGVEEWISKLRP